MDHVKDSADLKTGKDLRDHLVRPFSLWESSGSQYTTIFLSSKVLGLDCWLSTLHGYLLLRGSSLQSPFSQRSLWTRLLELPKTSHLTVTVAKYHSFPNIPGSHFAAGKKAGWVISRHLRTVISWRTSENHMGGQCFMLEALMTVIPTFHPQPSDPHFPRIPTSHKPLSP